MGDMNEPLLASAPNTSTLSIEPNTISCVFDNKFTLSITSCN